ncbi:MAG: GGDEF domain-containing protein [bacterium]
MTKPELAQKNEERENKTLVALLENLRSQKEKRATSPLDSIIKDLPKKLQNEVIVHAESLRRRMQERNIDEATIEDIVNEQAKERASDIRASYMDQRFDAPNGSYLRLEINRTLDVLIDDEKSIEKLNGHAILNFDVNGLKAVNDIGGHVAGDEYLRRIAKALSSPETTIAKKLKVMDIETFFTSNGGDEFAIILKGNIDFTDEKTDLLNEILFDYQAEIAKIDCSDLIDFSDEKIQEKLAGLTVPEGFIFQASVSAGAASFKEALTLAIEKLTDSDHGYDADLFAIMDETLKLSDERSMEDKKEIKTGWADSTNKNENLMAMITARNAEVVEALKQIKELKTKSAEDETRIKALEEQVIKLLQSQK